MLAWLAAAHAGAEPVGKPDPLDGDPASASSYSLDIEASVLTDRRSRGVSDTFGRPGAQVTATLAHASGWVGVLEIGSVSKHQFLNGKGVSVLAAGGYRWGDPDAWHFGIGAAREMFPGSYFDAPTSLGLVFDGDGNPVGATPGPVVRSNFNSTYAVLEAGYDALEFRYLNVRSRDYRGANTSSVCPFLSDGAAVLPCYLNGDRHTRGTQLVDADWRYNLPASIRLNLHLGYQFVSNFKELDDLDWGARLTRALSKGLEISLGVVGARTRDHALFLAANSDGTTRRLDRTALVASVSQRW